MDLQEIGWNHVDWIGVAQGRDKRQVAVNTVVDFGLHKMWGNS